MGRLGTYVLRKRWAVLRFITQVSVVRVSVALAPRGQDSSAIALVVVMRR
jgi:hypothetical protein